MAAADPHPGIRTASETPIRILPYTAEWSGAVAEFNRRVSPARPIFQVPETPAPFWLARQGDEKLYQEIFLAVEDTAVRGAYTFKHQEFSVGGHTMEVGMCRMPISEGIVNRHYGWVGVRLINDAVRRQPLLYGLGLGDTDAQVARLVKAMGWRVLRAVPFFFKVRNGNRFLREIRHVRTTRLRCVLLDAAAALGFGWAGARVASALLTRESRPRLTAERVGEFSTWADGLWQACRGRYSMVAVRDARALNILYPASDARFIRLKFLEGSRVAGWAVLLDTRMSGDKYFGNMRVGSIIDCFAAPEDAAPVIAAASHYLEQSGVDLLLSNQNHPAWSEGLRRAGFLPGPSNFFFLASRGLAKLLNEVDPACTGIHLNRGDGDGPINL